MKTKELRAAFTGLAFLSPNILGFLAFTTIPLIFSMVLAFSNWDLRLHNMFHDEAIRFVGLDNFVRLFNERDFWKFLGNTLFLMMGAPVAIVGSLLAAILLNKDLKGKTKSSYKFLVVGSIILASGVFLALLGLGSTALAILIAGLAGLVLVSGVLFGQTVYRTLFYLPNFTSGVAVFILWKKLYSPETGPINGALTKPLAIAGDLVNATPSWIIVVLSWGCLLIGALLAVWMFRSLFRQWSDGELGHGALGLGLVFCVLPMPFIVLWGMPGAAKYFFIAAPLLAGLWYFKKSWSEKQFDCAFWRGSGGAFMIAVPALVGQFVFVGISQAVAGLPAMASDGLQPPEWLTNYYWAKPSIMIMGLWAAIGSNNMLLYLAGLNNIPPELEEAADIDGASPLQKFWHVTWPQLAPITFFIVVMTVIGGLQGGFEIARTMTQGGPAGSTTTLSYFIYNEGFTTGRLGYSSAIAWVLFGMVFSLTLINWKFGSKYVND
jgi:multiple sugar transport system permease protein